MRSALLHALLWHWVLGTGQARDERGRRRLHGAFTGGFSAGYYNTVGSEEGWTPQTFVSTRKQRAGTSVSAAATTETSTGTAADTRATAFNRPTILDYMDDEDRAEWGSGTVVAQDRFKLDAATSAVASMESGAASSASAPQPFDSSISRAEQALATAMRVTVAAEADAIGVRLLCALGWRVGQGIGPRRRKRLPATVSDSDDIHAAKHLYAPDAVDVVRFDRRAKDEYHGLGYVRRHATLQRLVAMGEDADEAAVAGEVARARQMRRAGMIGGKAGFGVGAFEEEDEDVYEGVTAGQFTGGGRFVHELRDEEEEEDEEGQTDSPFRKPGATAGHPPPRKTRTSDGRPVIAGFVVAPRPMMEMALFPPVRVPQDYVPRHVLPEKSVDITTSAAATVDKTSSTRGVTDNRTAAATKAPSSDLQTALIASTQHKREQTSQDPHHWPRVDPAVARTALNGFMPFLGDEVKMERYRVFLKVQAGDVGLEMYTGLWPRVWRDCCAAVVCVYCNVILQTCTHIRSNKHTDMDIPRATPGMERVCQGGRHFSTADWSHGEPFYIWQVARAAKGARRNYGARGFTKGMIVMVHGESYSTSSSHPSSHFHTA